MACERFVRKMRMANYVKTRMLLLLAATAMMLVAMPAREAVHNAAGIVQDLMRPERKALEEGRRTCAEVAQAALALADSSDSEAEKLLLAKGAYGLYMHEGAFGRAMETLEALRDMIPDLSPQVVANIVESSFGGVSHTNDVRLCGLVEEAKTCVRYQDELEAALVESAKDPRNKALEKVRIGTGSATTFSSVAFRLNSDFRLYFIHIPNAVQSCAIQCGVEHPHLEDNLVFYVESGNFSGNPVSCEVNADGFFFCSVKTETRTLASRILKGKEESHSVYEGCFLLSAKCGAMLGIVRGDEILAQRRKCDLIKPVSTLDLIPLDND